MSTTGGPAPGWYDDPADPIQARYWDGERWTSQVRSKDAPMTPPPAYGAASYTTPAIAPRSGVNGLSIAALVLGILWIYWIGSILAVIFGHVSLSQLSRPDNNESGRGMAIAGLILGYIGVGMLALALVVGVVIGIGEATRTP